MIGQAAQIGRRNPVDMGLKGRHALVTGASRGIGRAIARVLVAEGADVLAVARSVEKLQTLAAPGAVPAAPPAVGRAAGSLRTRGVDLADAAAIDALAPELARTDVLVINTGGPPPGRAADITDAQWTQYFKSMFLAGVRLTRHALPGMCARRFGRILIVISSGVQEPIANLALSNALRAALVGWAKTLAGEVAADGVTVNCLAPGNIDTERLAELGRLRAERQGVPVEELRRQAQQAIPAGRFGTPEEFADVAAFLASERAAYVTGTIVRIDGGMMHSL